MAPGTVIVDLAAETGGNVEGSKPGEVVITAELIKAIDAFKKTFTTSSGELLIKDVPVDALEETEVDHASITVNR